MQYQVFVQRRLDSTYIASVLGILNCTVEGNTKEEVIARVKVVLEEQLANGEWVTISVNSSDVWQQAVPHLRQNETASPRKYAGIFAEDSTFDDFMEKLAAIRKEANAVEDDE